MVGLDAVSAFEELMHAIPTINSLRVFKYEPPPPAQNRVQRTEAEKAILKKALDLRRNYQLPFWDCVLVSCFSADDVPESILSAARLHISHQASDIELGRATVLAGGLKTLVAELTPNISLAITSEVHTSRGIEHLPLLDFHIPCSEANQKIVTSILQWMLPTGYILLRSGRSYHAWGTATVAESEYPKFLARAMLYSPIIDRAYLAHQLIEGRSALRISAGYPEKPIPTVICSPVS